MDDEAIQVLLDLSEINADIELKTLKHDERLLKEKQRL